MWSIKSSRKRSLTYLADPFRERSRIARELHDGIAQDLAAIGYRLDSEIGRSDTNPQSRQALRAIRDQITEVNSKVRSQIFQLRSPSEPTAQIQLESALSLLGVDFSIEGSLPDSEAGSTLFKILLELSRNSCEHGRAQKISLMIEPTKITLENDGLTSGPIRQESYGLIGVDERLAEIGWELRSEKGFSHLEIYLVT